MRAGTREPRPVLRTLGLTAAIALVMALVPGLASAQTAAPDARGTSAVCDGSYESNFNDIRGSAHEGNIRCMADYGLTEGLRGGQSYGPRLDVNRGQMASFIARFIEDYNDEDLPAGSANRFNDVPSSYVHASNINKLAAIGVVEGTGASAGQSYAPNSGVTRAQMGSFIRRALSYLDNGQVTPLSAPPAATANYFPDIVGSVHQANINAIAGVGIVQGFADGTYRPNALVKRDQMASFIMRAYDYAVTEGLGEDPDPTAPQVTVTAEAGAVAPGGTVNVTFAGDLLSIATVNVAGACVADGPASVGVDGVAAIPILADAADGPCVLTFTVTFTDGTSQTLTLTVPIETPAVETGSISGTVTEPGTTEPGGATFTAIAEDGYLQIGDELFDLPGCPEGQPPAEGDECIEFVGEVDADGNVTIGGDGISFPQLVTEFEAFPGVFVDVFIDISAPGGATGTADAETGAWTLDTALDIDVEVEGLAQCAISDIGLTLSTDGEGSPLTDGRATLFDDTFAVPVATGGALCAAVSGGLGLPSESGNNEVSFELLVDLEETEVEVPGAPIEGATVSVDGTDLSATTDADGNYTITGAPAGTWDVTATADGYDSETITDVVVVAGQDTSGVDFVLGFLNGVVD